MGRQKKTFSQTELKRANSAGFHCKSLTETAEYLSITRRTLFNWLKHEVFAEAVQAGKRRRERSVWRKMGVDPDKTEADFAELDAMFKSANDDDFGKPLEPKPGYILEYERIDYPDGSYREIWRQTPEPLPSLKDLQKAMRRKGGRYIF